MKMFQLWVCVREGSSVPWSHSRKSWWTLLFTAGLSVPQVGGKEGDKLSAGILRNRGFLSVTSQILLYRWLLIKQLLCLEKMVGEAGQSTHRQKCRGLRDPCEQYNTGASGCLNIEGNLGISPCLYYQGMCPQILRGNKQPGSGGGACL